MNDDTFKKELLKIQAAQARALSRIDDALEKLVIIFEKERSDKET